MRRLPSVDAELLQHKSLKQLVEIRAIADEHFFAELPKQTEREKLAGHVLDESPKLKAASNVMDLVQHEMTRRAELERQEAPSRGKGRR